MSTFAQSFNSSGYAQSRARRNVSNFREALPQVLAVSIKNVVLVSFGMSLGFPTILIAGLADPDEEMDVDNEQISWLASISSIFAPIGCLISGPISQKIGRRRTMQSAAVPLAATWLLFRFSNQVWQLYVGLATIGLLLGCIESSIITYVAEITTPQLRGILSSTGTVSIILGILLEFLLGTFFQWRDAAVLSLAVPVLAANLLILAPESPYWLISRGTEQEARESLAWLRGWIPVEDIEAEYKDIYKDLNQTVQVNPRTNSKCAVFLRPFGLVTFVFFLRHFTGITNLQTYAVEIFATYSTPMDKYYTTVILGLVELLGCVLCVALVHVLGKRILTFTTLACSVFCLVGTGTYSLMKGINELTAAEGTEIINWVPTGLLLGHALFSNAGLRILPWLLAGEVFPNEIRSCAVGVTTAIAYAFGFASNKLFFNILSLMSLPALFYSYAGLSLLGLVVLYFVLPETEGKSLYEIRQLFARTRGVDLNANSQHGMVRRTSELYGINFDLINITDEANTYTKFGDVEVPF